MEEYVYVSLLCVCVTLGTIAVFDMDMNGAVRQATFLVLQLVLYLLAVQEVHTTLPHPTVCGEGHCLCYQNRANCSNHGLTYIPKLDASIHLVDLSNNAFLNLSKSSWKNITEERIISLNISSSKIHKLEPTTFEKFVNLEALKLSDNPLSQKDLAIALIVPDFIHLSDLFIRLLNISDVSFFVSMKAVNIKQVNLDYNSLTVYNQSIFSKHRQLTIISAKRNRISSLIFSYSKHLSHLNLLGNTILHLPSFCYGNTPYFPRLFQLHIGFNDLDFLRRQFHCIPKLHTLHVSGLQSKTISRNSFVNLPYLTYLWLGNLLSYTHIEPYAFNNSKLKELSLPKSNIVITRTIDENAFKGLPNLKSLDISNSNLRYATNLEMLKLFGHLKSLQSINMGYCALQTIPHFIKILKNLTRLSFYGNHIKNISEGSFGQLKHLKHLELDMNEITTILETALPRNIRESLSSVNLAYNPFDCDCNLQWFLDWTKTNKTLFKWYPEKYQCKSPTCKLNVPLDKVYFSPYSCLLTFPVITSILGTSAVFMFVITLLSVLYKLRWRIRHYLYMKYFRQRQQQGREDLKDYAYDAYVIHSDEDEDWVVEEMLPCLEDQHHMKLCVPGRDFLPGGYILNNIDQAIQTSRHVIVVLSPSFVESEWCQAELSMAQSFVLDTRGNPLLAVLLEEPDARNMRHSLHVLLKSRAYIIWGEEEEAQQLFWTRLVESLGLEAIDPRN